MMKMKPQITAAIIISAFLISSCGGSSKVANVEKTVPTVLAQNTALEWANSSMEAHFIYEQNVGIAMDIIHTMMDRGESVGKGLFIDAAFLLFDQTKVYEFFKSTGRAGSEFRIREMGEYCRMQFEPSMIELMKRANEAGMSIYLMAPEEEITDIFTGLNSQNIMAQSCMMKHGVKYGRYATNLTLSELNEEGRIGLIITTSLGEIQSIQGELPIAGRSTSELYKTIGDKLLLFPNPAFN